jgi:hypothetical protein
MSKRRPPSLRAVSDDVIGTGFDQSGEVFMTVQDSGRHIRLASLIIMMPASVACFWQSAEGQRGGLRRRAAGRGSSHRPVESVRLIAITDGNGFSQPLHVNLNEQKGENHRE